jgi:hypothetical protein
MWWANHGSSPMAVNDLDYQVTGIVDPQRRGRQYLAVVISGLAGTRAAGFVLTRQPSAGRWTAATYALTKESDGSYAPCHPTRGSNGSTPHPMGPMSDNGENEYWLDRYFAQECNWS